MSERRAIPAVENLLQTPQATALAGEFGRTMVVDAIRKVLADIRARVTVGEAVPAQESIINQAGKQIMDWLRPTLIPVINATGVILHTNLGRAPLSAASQKALAVAAASYSTLEFDPEGGRRGLRSQHAETLLTRLTGAEAALVVNNNAGAVLLALSALARRKRVIISRTQLVEIGGGFRVPEVMAQSGAKLVEVGATNRVHLEDYAAALEEPAALVLRAHHSNFKIVGFTSEPPLADLAALAHERGALLMDDLGSGALVDTARYGVAHEPTVQESLAAGADVVCFSGDKLLGGPQAGIILGRKDLVDKIQRHPLARALRADKLCLAALSATLLHYLKDEADSEVPVLRMMALSPDAICRRAQYWRDALGQGEVIAGNSTIGGGSLPEETLPTWLLALSLPQPARFLSTLRRLEPPIIGRIENDRVLFDPRTVFSEQEAKLLDGIRAALGGKK